ncbi:MAG: hypothetical protein KDC53_23305 [Saprospiraceae bacterium]|nr:hypothetical protein [Saprospiraceae bacterium]
MENNRKRLLHKIAKEYVIDGLGDKNFEAIPYDENVTLRAPINPGGAYNPIQGKETLKSSWWAPLPDLVEKTVFLDSYVNEDLTAVTVEFYCDIINPKCRLRIMDRFKVDDAGNITDQENFFDPRSITNPGWDQ